MSYYGSTTIIYITTRNIETIQRIFYQIALLTCMVWSNTKLIDGVQKGYFLHYFKIIMHVCVL